MENPCFVQSEIPVQKVVGISFKSAQIIRRDAKSDSRFWMSVEVNTFLIVRQLLGQNVKSTEVRDAKIV